MSQGNDTKSGLSPVKSFIFTAARTVGVGNIAGMATAIYFGGPGAIFWLWILAIFGSGVALIEAILAQTFRVMSNGEYRGGPAYYMEKGMKNKKIGRIFAIVYAAVTFISMTLLMPGVQAHYISYGISDAFNVPVVLVGAIFALLLAFTIFGGLRRMGSTVQKISPFMAIIYILMSIFIIGANIEKLPAILTLIFKSAFGAEQIFAGITGATISWGIKRGVYANEVGLGTSAVTAAVGEVSHPAKQGLTGALSVFIGTFFVCTTSAIMMLMTGCYNVVDGAGTMIYEGLPGVAYGSAFVSAAIDSAIPGVGAPFIAIAILCFAFVALLAFYLYAESNMIYLFGSNKILINILKTVFTISVFIGTVLTASTVWSLGDIGNAMFAWINTISLFFVGGIGIKIFKDYDSQKKKGIKDPIFDPEALGIDDVADCWKEKSKQHKE
ncbi:MAG: alanine/glycine:cation symporter family protein [Oscillospiraceae bacterium]